MGNDRLSPGQQALIDALHRLADLELGGAEPAAVFKPAAWTAGARPAFDLARLVADDKSSVAGEGASGGGDAGTGRHDETGHGDVTRRGGADRNGTPSSSLPPAVAPLTEIVAAVKQGETSAAEVLAGAQARIEACDDALNAFITLCPERATAEARAVDDVVAAGERPRPLAGAPLAHKDIIATAGVRTTAASALLAHHVPTEDATVTARLANAGMVLLGKTNTHEFATGTTGTVSHFGAARNPWNTDHIAGGSSSGSAAALAAGMVPAATGSDTGGSIRIPAACCGIVGIKPTYGRVSRSGVLPFAWGLDHIGPMARIVRDVAVLLTAMAGADPYDRASASEPATDFTATLEAGVAGVRFAVPEPHFLALAAPPVADAVREAAAVLEHLGARRIEVHLPDDLAVVGPAAIALFLAEGGAVHRRTLERHPEAYCAETRAFLSLSEHVTAHHYLQAQRLRERLAYDFAAVFQGVDVLLTPTLPVTAPALDARTLEVPTGELDVRAAMTLFTRPFNLTGLPALSLPCGFVDDMPVGLQIVGRAWDEATVLRVAAAYEEATTWHRRRPPRFP